MIANYTLIGLVLSVILIVMTFYLLRKRMIRGKDFVFWLLVGCVIFAFSLVPNLVGLFEFAYGVDYTVTGITATVFIFFLSTTFYLDYKIGQMQNMLTKLAMEVSARKYGETSNPSSSTHEAAQEHEDQ